VPRTRRLNSDGNASSERIAHHASIFGSFNDWFEIRPIQGLAGHLHRCRCCDKRVSFQFDFHADRNFIQSDVHLLGDVPQVIAKTPTNSQSQQLGTIET
jgi:hypothetical protein